MKAHIFKSTLATSLVAFLFVLVSCEGPVGPAGMDGIDGVDGVNGVDGDVTCLVCHGTGTIETIDAQFHQSVHRAGAIAVEYAGGRSRCAQCHSNEGFVQYALNGSVDQDISAPTAWECSTCHTIHEKFDSTDWGLRLGDPISFIYDESVTADFRGGNICANCHQSRRPEPNVSNPGSEFTITSKHYGPHHGAQSNVLYGAGLAEIAGSASYPEAGSATHFTASSCTGCHMAEYADGQGGHTWNASLSSCTDCHAGISDFDLNGTITEVRASLDQLRDLLIAQNVIEEGLEEIFELDPETGDVISVIVSDGFHPVPATHTMAQTQAYFNWVGLLEDRSFGVHNPAYTRALITNSIEAID
jgi:hypothetical protein